MLDKNTSFVPTWADLSTKQRIDLIQEVWKPGCSTPTIATRIAERITGPAPTRNMILGIYHRNPDLRREYPLPNKGPKKVRERPRGKLKQLELGGARMEGPPPPVKAATPVYVKAEHRQFDETSRRVPLEELGRGQCHWPINAPEKGEGLYLFCGHPTEELARYCPHHRARSYVPMPKPKRRKKRV